MWKRFTNAIIAVGAGFVAGYGAASIAANAFAAPEKGDPDDEAYFDADDDLYDEDEEISPL